MPTIKEQIAAGLHQDNLPNLISSCKAKFQDSPILYLTLISIFRFLEMAYENHEIVSYEKSQKIDTSLIPLMLQCIENPSMGTLNALAKKYDELMR